ncbi:MAG TPA: DUF4260 domain-containing protein [Microvirga sp.]|nr:DUF4260 domain-containing protein [Microvirga sp.]
MKAVAGMPRLLLRLEGLALLATATWAFAHMGQPWWVYAGVFFLPDLSFAAYAAGPKVGSIVYNALHSTIGPAILGSAGLLLGHSLLLGIAAIWAAHVGFDRMLGYGLKYATAFTDTHLGRIGRNPAAA